MLATAEEQVNLASRQLVWRVVAALSIGVLVAAVAGAGFARRVSGPLTRAARAADRIAGEERGVAVPGSSVPELSAVTNALTALDRSLAV